MSECLASNAKPTAMRMNPSVTQTAELLIVSFWSSRVAQRTRRSPKKAKSPPVADDLPRMRTGPRLATKKPDVWRAAVAWVGISDLHKLYVKSMEHFKYYFREQMGDPEKDFALWRDRSAIEFAEGLKAKLLIVHGVNDPRCPVEQSRIFRDRLVELGRKEGEDFEYVELTDEGHGSTDTQQKIRTFRILADYLERVLN